MMNIFDFPVLPEKESYEYFYLIKRIQWLLADYHEEKSDYISAGYIKQKLKDSDSLDKLIINLRILNKKYVEMPSNIEEKFC